MKNAAETTYQPTEDEEGVAEGAASLGADGGPVATVPAEADDDAFESELEAFDDDDSWLSEELSDEELAALGEEDFGDDIFSEEDFTAEDAPAATVSAALNATDPVAEDNLPSDEDFSFDDAFDDTELSEEVAEPDENVSVETEEEISQGALVAATAAIAGQDIEESTSDIDVSGYGEEEIDHRPVPRISIHAFCEAPDTTTLLEKASVDRRLSKAHLTIHMGGINKAIDHFQTASTPNLIILETMAGGAEIFAKLAELAEVCDPSTKVIIIGRVNDIILYRELIKQGVSEYIVRPNSPLQIIKTIADLYVDPSAPPIGKTIAFVGARGGVGSSTLAHNVGWCSAEEFHSDTVILDLDLPFGTVSLDFDEEASAGLVEALASPERLDDVLLDRLLQKHTDRLSLFTAPSMLDRDFDLDDQAFETVLDVVRGTAPTIVVDVPHLWTSWSKRILMTADEIVITATPDLASFRNTKNLIDILGAARPNDSSPTLVINQFDPKTSAVQAAQFAEHVGIKPAQVINWDPQLFGAAATNASPVTEVGGKSKTAQSIRDLAAQMLGRNETNIARPKFSLAGMFKKKR
ncbi:AAA family ATPase [Hyphococcus lacteus]|uniref:Cellulose synthase operon protein YhjQ/BcsQ n=1 Tax=Hyphococcus lacteus TaxID=3143536 RepID=A0ABV3Z2U6_9PROT